MRRWVYLLAVFAVVGALLAAQSVRARTRPHSDAHLTVAELAAHPAEHVGSLVVDGVVAKVDVGRSLVLLSDGEDCSSCESGCGEVPVRWSGKLPKMGEHLAVAGRLTKEGDRFALAGSSAKPLRDADGSQR